MAEKLLNRFVPNKEHGFWDGRCAMKDKMDNRWADAACGPLSLRVAATPAGADLLRAVLCWGGAAWRLKDRDEWIDWDPVTRANRLALVVQLRRFLVVERARRPNLASRCRLAVQGPPFVRVERMQQVS
ncbi:MAG: hypothetical protein ACO3JG_01590 [Luteolibacter sp.]